MSKFTEALKKIQANREPDPQPAEKAPPPVPVQAPEASRDRRLSSRNRCFIQARALISSPGEDCWINQARILNFSESGILFELEHPLSNMESLLCQDTLIRVQIILNPETREQLEIEGRVIRYLKKPKTSLGIKLTEDSLSFSNEINASLKAAG